MEWQWFTAVFFKPWNLSLMDLGMTICQKSSLKLTCASIKFLQKACNQSSLSTKWKFLQKAPQSIKLVWFNSSHSEALPLNKINIFEPTKNRRAFRNATWNFPDLLNKNLIYLVLIFDIKNIEMFCRACSPVQSSWNEYLVAWAKHFHKALEFFTNVQ